MKSTVKIIKYIGLGILILLILIVSGLTVYYHLNYQSPPPLSEQGEYEFEREYCQCSW